MSTKQQKRDTLTLDLFTSYESREKETFFFSLKVIKYLNTQH